METSSTIFRFNTTKLNSQEVIRMNSFRGKPLLIVNVATY
jgi:glutathione peroxidase-family protein